MYLILNEKKFIYRNKAKKTPLHWAAERNFVYIMYFLINHGAELEAKDMAGRTPLFLAVKNGTKETLDTIKVFYFYAKLNYLHGSYCWLMEQIHMLFLMGKNSLLIIQMIQS